MECSRSLALLAPVSFVALGLHGCASPGVDTITSGGYTLPAIKGGAWSCDGNGYNCESASTAFAGGGEGGTAETHVYACVDWSVGSKLWQHQEGLYKKRTGSDVLLGVGSFGSDEADMGKCYQLEIQGSKTIIAQAVNTGPDVSSGQFDLQQMAGGVGLCNALTDQTSFADGESTNGSAKFPMFTGDNEPWGPKRDGGFDDDSGCDKIPLYPNGAAGALTAFPNGESDLQTLCKAAFTLGTRRSDGTNPTLTEVQRVQCPEEVYTITGLRLSSDDSLESQSSSGGELTRMWDGCKPSSGWLNNVKGADPNYPALIACGPDGISRVSV